MNNTVVIKNKKVPFLATYTFFLINIHYFTYYLLLQQQQIIQKINILEAAAQQWCSGFFSSVCLPDLHAVDVCSHPH